MEDYTIVLKVIVGAIILTLVVFAFLNCNCRKNSKETEEERLENQRLADEAKELMKNYKD